MKSAFDASVSPLQLDTAHRLLGIASEVPLEKSALRTAFSVTCFPVVTESPAIAELRRRHCRAFTANDVTVLPLGHAAVPGGRRPKVPAGVVVITSGKDGTGLRATDYVSSLSATIIVGLFERPCPYDSQPTPQAKIDWII